MILTVLLTILKIIGIILASIIGLVVLVLILALFVPIRYKLNFIRTGEEGDLPIIVSGQVSYLLHILHASAKYSDAAKVKVRVFGIPVFKYPSNKKKKSELVIDNSKEQVADNISNVVYDETDRFDIDNEDDAIDDILGEDETDADNLTLFERIKAAISDVLDALNKLKCTIKHAYDIVKEALSGSKEKMDEVSKNVKYYHAIFTSDLFDRTFAKTKKKLIRLIKSILPKVFDINLEVGFDDPSTTGQILAIYSTLYAVLWNHIHLKGNFEESIIKADGKIRGRIYGFSFLKLGIYYLTDRDLKKLIRLLKKEGRKNGRKQ